MKSFLTFGRTILCDESELGDISEEGVAVGPSSFWDCEICIGHSFIIEKNDVDVVAATAEEGFNGVGSNEAVEGSDLFGGERKVDHAEILSQTVGEEDESGDGHTMLDIAGVVIPIVEEDN